MIYSTFDQMPFYFPLNPSLRIAFEFLQRARDASAGRYALDNGVTAIVKEGVASRTAMKEYEAHRRFVDVHCLLGGKERLAICDIELLSLYCPYDEEKDCAIFAPAKGNVIDLSPGEFCLCFPRDGHEAVLCDGAPSPYRKIVFKLPV